MLQQAEEGYDTDSEEEPHLSPANVNQNPARRKRRYFKGSGGLRRRKYCKRNVINSASPPHPSSSQSEVMPKDVPTAMTDGPVSPPTPLSVIEVSDDGGDNDRIIEILDDDYDNDSDEPTGKTSIPSDGRVILSFDGKPIPVIQVATIVATDDSQNFCVEGDLDVQLPGHLYDVQQDAKPAASNSGSSHVSGSMVPCSSVDRSTSKSSYFSVDGNISIRSLLSSVDSSDTSKFSHSSVDGGISIRSLLSSVDSSNTSKFSHSSVYGSTSSKSIHSSVDGSSSSTSLHSSVDGSSSYTSVRSSPAVINHRQPSILGTAGENLLKSYLTSQIAEGGCAFPAQVATVAQEVDNKVSSLSPPPFFIFLFLFFIFFLGYMLKCG
jgi:hypothetical protein